MGIIWRHYDLHLYVFFHRSQLTQWPKSFTETDCGCIITCLLTRLPWRSVCLAVLLAGAFVVTSEEESKGVRVRHVTSMIRLLFIFACLDIAASRCHIWRCWQNRFDRARTSAFTAMTILAIYLIALGETDWAHSYYACMHCCITPQSPVTICCLKCTCIYIYIYICIYTYVSAWSTYMR